MPENDPLGHANLARLLGRRLPDEDLEAVNALLADPPEGIKGRSYLHSATARVLDARGRYREAAEHLRAIHALREAEDERTGQGYDAAAHARFISRMIDACSSEFFQRTHGLGLATQRPVFIFGLQRSGTTLVEQILAGHSQIFGAGELMLGVADFQALAGAGAATLDPISRTDLSFRGLTRVDADTIQSVARQHLLELDKLNASAPRIVDKLPGNYLYLGLLTVLFPQARFIHCRRDLRDVAISVWMAGLTGDTWPENVEHTVSRFEQYRRLMAHWRKLLDGRWLDCDYEQTVADLPGAARRLVAWCGLEWELPCIDFHLVKRPVRTPSCVQVRQPVFDRSVGRWKHYQELLEPVLSRLT